MPEDVDLTAYCGLYCRDCIPSHKELFAVTQRLQELIQDLQLDKYALVKAKQTYWSKANEVFSKYGDFSEFLQAIRELECKVTCREGGGYKGSDCEIRNCALGKKLKGCWECSKFKTCDLLAPLEDFHPNLEYNLSLIKANGVDHWAAQRKSHYRWG
ncbi:MAG: DUF3795 domain-containing protein [Dehalococcoidia bacterium]|nr:DUF3795 domain-containing protein [Dehalococcoidia bacterium]MDD5495379.1 DUF3795 domain-containing protein [Dehalococcoidia bacterium]